MNEKSTLEIYTPTEGVFLKEVRSIATYGKLHQLFKRHPRGIEACIMANSAADSDFYCVGNSDFYSDGAVFGASGLCFHVAPRSILLLKISSSTLT